MVQRRCLGGLFGGCLCVVICVCVFVRSCLTHSRHFASLHSNGKRHYLPATFYHHPKRNSSALYYTGSLYAQNWTPSSTDTTLCDLVMMLCVGVCVRDGRVYVWMDVASFFVVASVSWLNHLWGKKVRFRE